MYKPRRGSGLKSRPYNLLLITAIVLFISSLFSGNTTIDIILGYTYYVLPLSYMLRLMVLILLFLWILYRLTQQFLFSNGLTRLHVLLVIVCAISVHAIPYILTYDSASDIGAPRRYYENIPDSIKIIDNRNTAIIVTFIILSAVQFLYIANLLIGLIKREKTAR